MKFNRYNRRSGFRDDRMQHQRPRDAKITPPLPDLLKAVLVLAGIFLCAQVALVPAYGQPDSRTAGQIVALGFLPWVYLTYAGLRLFKCTRRPQTKWKAGAEGEVWVWLHVIAIGATLVGEMLLSWALIDSRYMLGAPFGAVSEPHTIPTLALCFGAPFLLGVPACFSFALTLSRLAGAPRAGFMPGLLLAVGLLHPFTLLGATTSGIVLFGGLSALAAVNSESVWIFSATTGLVLGTVAIETLQLLVAGRQVAARN